MGVGYRADEDWRAEDGNAWLLIIDEIIQALWARFDGILITAGVDCQYVYRKTRHRVGRCRAIRIYDT